MSRRKADEAISKGRVIIDGRLAVQGDIITLKSIVTLDSRQIKNADSKEKVTIMLNKPIGYICSRNGQGGKTIYELLPLEYRHLKPAGRLDKDSSGLLLLTNDGDLANQLTHPSFKKEKVYEVTLDKELSPGAKTKIEKGIKLEDGLSRLQLFGSGKNWTVTMHEGRNRQIRRTFEILEYRVVKLHRIQFGEYKLSILKTGEFYKVST